MKNQPIDAPFARQFLQRLHAAVNAHDASAIAALCCEDVIWEDPAAPETLRGRDAVYKFHHDIMFPAIPDTRVALMDGPYLSLDGTGVAARLRIIGTMTGPLTPPGFAPTGGPVEFETAEFSHFKDGLLAHHTVILNMLDLARQIGAVPRTGTLGARVGVWIQHVAAYWARAKTRRRIQRRMPSVRALRGHCPKGSAPMGCYVVGHGAIDEKEHAPGANAIPKISNEDGRDDSVTCDSAIADGG